MGGKVEVESEFGEGTCFKIKISTKTNPYYANHKHKNNHVQKESNYNNDHDFEKQSLMMQDHMNSSKYGEIESGLDSIIARAPVKTCKRKMTQ